MRITLHDLADIQHPQPLPAFAEHAVFSAVLVGVVVDVGIEFGQYLYPVIRMHQAGPAFEAIPECLVQFTFAVTENTQPDVIVDDDAKAHVPIPQTERTALQRQVRRFSLCSIRCTSRWC